MLLKFRFENFIKLDGKSFGLIYFRLFSSIIDLFTFISFSTNLFNSAWDYLYHLNLFSKYQIRITSLKQYSVLIMYWNKNFSYFESNLFADLGVCQLFDQHFNWSTLPLEVLFYRNYFWKNMDKKYQYFIFKKSYNFQLYDGKTF